MGQNGTSHSVPRSQHLYLLNRLTEDTLLGPWRLDGMTSIKEHYTGMGVGVGDGGGE